MLRQAVFLCLLLAGMAVAQVDNIQIFVLTGVNGSKSPTLFEKLCGFFHVPEELYK